MNTRPRWKEAITKGPVKFSMHKKKEACLPSKPPRLFLLPLLRAASHKFFISSRQHLRMTYKVSLLVLCVKFIFWISSLLFFPLPFFVSLNEANGWLKTSGQSVKAGYEKYTWWVSSKSNTTFLLVLITVSEGPFTWLVAAFPSVLNWREQTVKL